MWLLYFVCYLFFFRYDSMDQFSTHSCVSRNHRQPSETSVPYYTYSPATDRLFWRHVKKKNVPWHILAPRAVACDNLHLRASAHLWRVSAFLCNRDFLGIPCYIKTAAGSAPAAAFIRFYKCALSSQPHLFISCSFCHYP